MYIGLSLVHHIPVRMVLDIVISWQKKVVSYNPLGENWLKCRTQYPLIVLENFFRDVWGSRRYLQKVGEAWFWDVFPWLNWRPMGVLLSCLYLVLCMIHGKTKTSHSDERVSISTDLPMNYCVRSHISNGMSRMNLWWSGYEFTWFDDLPMGIINIFCFFDEI